jgi:hypothetical protein
MKHALANQVYLLEIFKELSSTNSEIRNCIQINKIFRDLKCRPKIYNKARWTGGMTLLLSVKRAYDKGALENMDYPVEMETIEMYIQILLPGYQFSLGMQSNHSSIADVIPAVLRLVFVWDKMEIDCAEGKELCYFLIHFLRLKFKDELDSPIYQVIIINVAIRFPIEFIY